jgi:acyl dehydratase
MSSPVLPPSDARYWEDYVAGAVYDYGVITLDRDELIAFARKYDPQVFHVDEAAAQGGPFGGLIASGWQTGAMAMRLYADHFLTKVASLASPGLEELRWVRPFRPGETLSIRVEILETRRSQTKPDRGLIKVLVEGFNQDRELVISFRAVNIIGVRPAA